MTNKIQPLRPYMTFTDDKGSLAKEAYDFLFGLFQRVGGSLDNLNAATLQNQTWEEPGLIGSETPSTGKFTELRVTGTTHLDGPVNFAGSGISHMRKASGLIPAATETVLTCTWPTPFADNNYTVNVTVVGEFLRLAQVEEKTATYVNVRVANDLAFTTSGIVHLIALHD